MRRGVRRQPGSAAYGHVVASYGHGSTATAVSRCRKRRRSACGIRARDFDRARSGCASWASRGAPVCRELARWPLRARAADQRLCRAAGKPVARLQATSGAASARHGNVGQSRGELGGCGADPRHQPQNGSVGTRQSHLRRAARDLSSAFGFPDRSSSGFMGAGGIPPFGCGSSMYSKSGSSFQGPRMSSP